MHNIFQTRLSSLKKNTIHFPRECIRSAVECTKYTKHGTNIDLRQKLASSSISLIWERCNSRGKQRGWPLQSGLIFLDRHGHIDLSKIACVERCTRGVEIPLIYFDCGLYNFSQKFPTITSINSRTFIVEEKSWLLWNQT